MEQKGDGWLIFAAIVLGIAGIMRIFDAIWAFRYHGVIPENLQGAIFGHSLKTYGWVYLVVGIVLILLRLRRGGPVTGQPVDRHDRRCHRSPSARSGGCRTTRCGRSPTCGIGVLVVYGLAAYGSREVWPEHHRGCHAGRGGRSLAGRARPGLAGHNPPATNPRSTNLRSTNRRSTNPQLPGALG